MEEKPPIWKLIAMLIIGFALLLIGGRVLVSGAGEIGDAGAEGDDGQGGW